jgi:alpha-1,2-mannosyltransferase
VIEEVIKQDIYGRVVLVMAGSTRNSADEALVQQLRAFITSHHLDDNALIAANPSQAELQHLLAHAAIGLHTMWNEHFGISIVESMAAGVLMIAHHSGGPASDIIEHGRTGFLATTAEEYAQCIKKIVEMNEEDRQQMRTQARRSTQRFSDEVFVRHFDSELRALITLLN